VRFLMVGTGSPIPPTGWGAVEKLIWEQKCGLEKLGHTVDIENPRKHKTVSGVRARPWQYDLVHVQLDSRIRLWNRLGRVFKFPHAVTTYYGYAAWPERWRENYIRCVPELLKAPVHITLSREIETMLRGKGYTGAMYHLPSGIHTTDIHYLPQPVKGALVLGRIEERKKQQYLCEVMRGKPVQLDLIGPLGPETAPNFNGNGENVLYRGPWSRDEVNRHLTEYACLILLSDGEAHPIVVLEALAAGVSVVVSPEASHNLDPKLPFIHIVDRDYPNALAAAITQAVAENPMYRAEIRRYCQETFDWSVLLPRYVTIAEQIVTAHKK
jgi:glycosyltransferase involved in cell wall biosynthesis